MSVAAEQHDVVTGSFGYTGKYIARGRRVVSLTGRDGRESPFGDAVPAVPFTFDRPDTLAANLANVDTLYNTYWVRFDYGRTTFADAVRNTKVLFDAARRAGVRRIAHISITNPNRASPLPYFAGKAELEDALRDTGISHAILRPTVIFGAEDILINNIAWLVRRLPAFLIAGDGSYRLQPVAVADVARLAVEHGAGEDNVTIDAVGPEVYRFEDLVRLIARTLGRRIAALHVPPRIALLAARGTSWFVRDVLLTRDELAGLMADLLVSDRPATGEVRLNTWLAEHANELGRRYTSELNRHYRRPAVSAE